MFSGGNRTLLEESTRLRKAQYLPGHRHVSCTEGYKQQLIDDLKADARKFHPFKVTE